MNLIRLREKIESKRRKILHREEKAISAIIRTKERKKHKIDQQYEQKISSRKEQFIEERYKLDKIYHNCIAGEIAVQLARDYEILQSRSLQLEFSQEELSKVQRLASLLSQTKRSSERKRLEDILDVTIADERMKNAIKTYEGENLDEAQVTSYIGVGEIEGKVVCQLLVPINGELDRTLPKELETKIQLVLDQGSVTTNQNIGFNKKMDIVQYKMSEIHFNADIDVSNGFQVYTLVPSFIGEQQSTKTICAALESKLDELQPDKFKLAGLTHKVMPLEFPIIQSFITGSFTVSSREKNYPSIKAINELESYGPAISREVAEELIGFTQKRLSLLITKGIIQTAENGEIVTNSLRSYVLEKIPIKQRENYGDEETGKRRSVNPEAVKGTAYAKLDEFNHELNMHELQYVLGFGTLSGIQSAARRNMNIIKHDRKIYVKKEDVKAFLDTHNYSGRIWMSIK